MSECYTIFVIRSAHIKYFNLLYPKIMHEKDDWGRVQICFMRALNLRAPAEIKIFYSNYSLL
jgi:hypothetical protein